MRKARPELWGGPSVLIKAIKAAEFYIFLLKKELLYAIMRKNEETKGG